MFTPVLFFGFVLFVFLYFKYVFKWKLSKKAMCADIVGIIFIALFLVHQYIFPFAGHEKNLPIDVAPAYTEPLPEIKELEKPKIVEEKKKEIDSLLDDFERKD